MAGLVKQPGGAWRAVGSMEERHSDNPERTLWQAVLEDALTIAAGGGGGAVTDAERAEALEWIAGDGDAPCGFVWVCEVLDLDAGAVRGAIAAIERKAA